MPSIPSIFTARSGLFAQRRALELVGQNVANAGTAGYTRQEPSFVATAPEKVINSAGRGVAEVNILRYRDEFLDRQYRSRNGASGYFETRSGRLQQVEKILGDLSETGLRVSLDDFFNSWQNLSLRPADMSARIQVTQAASDFLTQAKLSFDQLATERMNIDEAIRSKVSDINSAAAQLAKLNTEIMNSEINGQSANGLRDRRDMLIDSLSRLAGTTTHTQDDGTVTVYLGSLLLVNKEFAYTIDQTIAQEPDRDPSATVDSLQQFLTQLTWHGTANAASPLSGDLRALLDVRDNVIPNYMHYLDMLVRNVATEVNNLHTAGLDPLDQTDIFSVGSTWMDIHVNQAVLDDPRLVRAAAFIPVNPGDPVPAGDGDRARAIAAVRDALIMQGPPVGTRDVTPGEYLRTMYALVGLEVQNASWRSESASLQLQQAENQRQSVSGVSLDDEMTKMIQFQQAYNAAARMMTTIDEALDIVINRMGLVGR